MSTRTLTAVVAAAAACVGLFGYAVADSASSRPPSVSGELGGSGGSHHRDDGLVGVADGVVAPGTTVFATHTPAITKLDPALLNAIREAATDASSEGIVFYVDSGWRSRSYQRQLFRDAVSKYGSVAEAERWVAPPGTSAHESGHAVDIGHSDAAAWLAAHGAAYGLCQIYRNESWHFELRSNAARAGCPPMYADASDDPRTQR